MTISKRIEIARNLTVATANASITNRENRIRNEETDTINPRRAH